MVPSGIRRFHPTQLIQIQYRSGGLYVPVTWSRETGGPVYLHALGTGRWLEKRPRQEKGGDEEDFDGDNTRELEECPVFG